jgi:hypothetical protein
LKWLKHPPAWATFSVNPRRCGNVYAIDGVERWLVHNYLRHDEADFDAVDRDRSIRQILGVGSDFRFEVLGQEDWIARRLVADRFPLEVVAITLRENPLVWKNSWTAIAYRAGTVLRTRTFEVEIVDRLGAGDSFAAGLIHGLLENDLQKGLDYGVAVSAIKHSIPGDFAWVTRDEVESLLRGHGLRISR